ncbi:hypothetical protein [Oscillatoria sp. HE19RPO]|uniref:hypothetical protein n=1 Tax=Oscillatoria sp. HE19RPO TaxID=2954806 RepID=UPI0020C51A4C|nr:hypothetical protein [Oscillatoria sp. HE19RPO]
MNNNSKKLLLGLGVTTEPCCPETPQSSQAGPRFDERVQQAIARSKVQAELSLDPTSLSEMVQEAIASLSIPVNPLVFVLRVHIPFHLYAESESWLQKINQPAGGYNVFPSPSDGAWYDHNKQTWIREPILLVQIYMNQEVLRQHLKTMLEGYSALGKALGETAIAIELLTNQMMIIIPTD